MNLKKFIPFVLLATAGFGAVNRADAQMVKGGVGAPKPDKEVPAAKAKKPAEAVRVPILRQLMDGFKTSHPGAVADKEIHDISLYAGPKYLEARRQYQVKGKNGVDTLYIMSVNDPAVIPFGNPNINSPDSSAGILAIDAFVKKTDAEEFDVKNKIWQSVSMWDENLYASGTTALSVVFDYQNGTTELLMDAHRDWSQGKVIVKDAQGNQYLKPATNPGRQMGVDTTFGGIKNPSDDKEYNKARKEVETHYREFMNTLSKDVVNNPYANRSYTSLESFLFDANDATNFGKKFAGLSFPKPAEKVADLPPTSNEIFKPGPHDVIKKMTFPGNN